VGHLDGRKTRLKGGIGISGAEGAKRRYTEERRAEIIAKLEAFEARLKNMSEPEREAWFNHPSRLAAFQELEEEVQRRLERGA
jgi:hypothetical protein